MARFEKKAGVGQHYLRDGSGLRAVADHEVIECDILDLGSALDKFTQLPDSDPSQNAIGEETDLKEINPIETEGVWFLFPKGAENPINEVGLTREEASEMVGYEIPPSVAEVTESEEAEEVVKKEKPKKAKRSRRRKSRK